MTVDVSNKHTTPSFDKDLVTVLKVLESETVFVSVPGRHHTTFKLKCGLLEKLGKAQLISKIEKKTSSSLTMEITKCSLHIVNMQIH